MKKLLPAVLLLAACEGPPPAIAGTPYQPDSGNLFVRCGALIDGIADVFWQTEKAKGMGVYPPS